MKILLSGTSRAPTIMSLVRYLFLLAAHHFISFTASSVRGKSKPISDSLSHFQFQRFCRLALHVDSIPNQIPQQHLSHLKLCCHINATSTWLRVLALLLGKFMLLPNTASWIAVLRTVAYLLWDQLFQPVLIRFCCHLADTLYYSSIKVYLSAIRSLHIEEGLPSLLADCL